MGQFPLGNLSALAARLQHSLGPAGFFIYTNEGFRSGREGGQRCETAADCPSTFNSGAGAAVCATFHNSSHKYCNQPQWPSVPAGLDFISANVYNVGAKEAAIAKQHYEHYLFPRLQPHTKVFLVPGLYGPNGTAHDPAALHSQDLALTAKLRAHLAWAQSDGRIAGLMPWHWLRATEFRAPINDRRRGAVSRNAASDCEVGGCF
eukprot:SAG11_NODE_106_length_16423_cov_51.220840_10_plen_205_part_00